MAVALDIVYGKWLGVRTIFGKLMRYQIRGYRNGTMSIIRVNCIYVLVIFIDMCYIISNFLKRMGLRCGYET